MQEQKLKNHYFVNSYYRKLTTVTVVAVYLLILAGGIVRSTGSGMGCPDWPKCFGSWVPPTDVSELPGDYQEFYSNYRHEKNVKFAKYLDIFGYSEIGKQILADESIKEEAEFNPAKTWTEYVNRLVGAIVGFLILLLFVGSLKYFKSYSRIFWLALASLVLVLFQGWLGSIVVSTNLLQWLITLHMVLAIVIVAVLIALFYFSNLKKDSQVEVKRVKGIQWILVFNILLLVFQIVLGTQVRESLDLVAERLGEVARDSWISNMGLIFLVHRSYSLILLIMSVLLFYFIKKQNWNSTKMVEYTKLLVILYLLEIGSGAVMAYFAIPFWVQPIHLLLSTLLVGLQFYLLLLISFNKEVNNKNVYAI